MPGKEEGKEGSGRPAQLGKPRRLRASSPVVVARFGLSGVSSSFGTHFALATVCEGDAVVEAGRTPGVPASRVVVIVFSSSRFAYEAQQRVRQDAAFGPLSALFCNRYRTRASNVHEKKISNFP